MSGLCIAVAHINASTINKVTTEELVLALRHGTVHVEGISERSGGRISFLFTELTPNLIMRCIREAGATAESAHALYLETIKDWHRAPGWEETVQHLLENPDYPLEQLRGSVKAYHRPFDPADD